MTSCTATGHPPQPRRRFRRRDPVPVNGADMLDDTVDVPPTDSQKDAPKASRRRRAVSRPAGPPAGVTATTDAIATPAVDDTHTPAEVVAVAAPPETGDVPGSTTTSDAAMTTSDAAG